MPASWFTRLDHEQRHAFEDFINNHRATYAVNPRTQMIIALLSSIEPASIIVLFQYLTFALQRLREWRFNVGSTDSQANLPGELVNALSIPVSLPPSPCLPSVNCELPTSMDGLAPPTPTLPFHSDPHIGEADRGQSIACKHITLDVERMVHALETAEAQGEDMGEAPLEPQTLPAIPSKSRETCSFQTASRLTSTAVTPAPGTSELYVPPSEVHCLPSPAIPAPSRLVHEDSNASTRRSAVLETFTIPPWFFKSYVANETSSPSTTESATPTPLAGTAIPVSYSPKGQPSKDASMERCAVDGQHATVQPRQTHLDHSSEPAVGEESLTCHGSPSVTLLKQPISSRPTNSLPSLKSSLITEPRELVTNRVCYPDAASTTTPSSGLIRKAPDPISFLYPCSPGLSSNAAGFDVSVAVKHERPSLKTIQSQTRTTVSSLPNPPALPVLLLETHSSGSADTVEKFFDPSKVLLVPLQEEVLKLTANVKDIEEKIQRVRAERDEARSDVTRAIRTADLRTKRLVNLKKEMETRDASLIEANKAADGRETFHKVMRQESDARYALQQTRLQELSELVTGLNRSQKDTETRDAAQRAKIQALQSELQVGRKALADANASAEELANCQKKEFDLLRKEAAAAKDRLHKQCEQLGKELAEQSVRMEEQRRVTTEKMAELKDYMREREVLWAEEQSIYQEKENIRVKERSDLEAKMQEQDIQWAEKLSALEVAMHEKEQRWVKERHELETTLQEGERERTKDGHGLVSSLEGIEQLWTKEQSDLETAFQESEGRWIKERFELEAALEEKEERWVKSQEKVRITHRYLCALQQEHACLKDTSSKLIEHNASLKAQSTAHIAAEQVMRAHQEEHLMKEKKYFLLIARAEKLYKEGSEAMYRKIAELKAERDQLLGAPA